MPRPMVALRFPLAAVGVFAASTAWSQPAAPSGPGPGDAAVPGSTSAGPTDALPVAGVAEEPAPAAAAETPPAPPEPLPPAAEAPAPPPVAAAPTPAPAPPSAEPTPVAPAAPAAPDMPEGEAERMAERPLGPGVYRPGKGFTLQTEDKDFALTARLWGQLLYTFVSPGVAGVEDRHSVQMRRARLSFAGNVWGADTRYKVELGFAPRDLRREAVPVGGLPDAAVTSAGAPAVLATQRDVVHSSPLLDWYVEFAQLRELNVRAGQGKVPFSRQRVMPDSDMQFVDGRITSEEFGFDRDLGVDFRSPDFLGAGVFRYYAGLYAGEGPNGSDRTLGAGEPGFMYVVRVELLPFGMFADYSEADFERTDDARLSLGLAYALVQGDAVSPQADAFGAPILGGADQTPLVDFNSNNFTVDAMFKVSGFSLETAFHWRKVNGNFGALDPQNGIGWALQAGYLIPRSIVELVGAGALIRGTTSDTSLGDQNELGLGVNCYLARHFLKLQLDVFHLWAPETTSGGMTTGGFGDGDNRVRLQLQASL